MCWCLCLFFNFVRQSMRKSSYSEWNGLGKIQEAHDAFGYMMWQLTYILRTSSISYSFFAVFAQFWWSYEVTGAIFLTCTFNKGANGRNKGREFRDLSFSNSESERKFQRTSQSAQKVQGQMAMRSASRHVRAPVPCAALIFWDRNRGPVQRSCSAARCSKQRDNVEIWTKGEWEYIVYTYVLHISLTQTCDPVYRSSTELPCIRILCSDLVQRPCHRDDVEREVLYRMYAFIFFHDNLYEFLCRDIAAGSLNKWGPVTIFTRETLHGNVVYRSCKEINLQIFFTVMRGRAWLEISLSLHRDFAPIWIDLLR